MSTQIQSPVSNAGSNPTMYAHELFRGQSHITFTTGALDDDDTYTFYFNESGSSIMDGWYKAYVPGSTDIACEFTISGGDTITILVDHGGDFVANATTTDAKIQIDADANGLTIVNRIDAGIAGLEIVKLM